MNGGHHANGADTSREDDVPADLPAAALPEAVAAAVAGLDAQLETLLGARLWQLGDHELAALAQRFERARNRLDAARLAVLQRMDVRGTAATLGATSTAGWMASTSNVRHAAARSDVSLAESLASWPALQAALASGAVSIDQARVCVKGLEALPDEVDADTLDRAEAHLVELCRDHEPTVLARLCRHLQTVIDPDGQLELEDDERRAVADRRLRISSARDGGVRLSGWFDTEGAATIMTALDPLAAPRPTTAEGPDLRTPAARSADALVELARRMLDTGTLPVQRSERPHLTVTLDLAALRVEPHAAAAELDRGGPLSAEAARRLACDAKVVPVVLDGAGTPLDVGRDQRTVPRHLRRALVVRDGGCAFPGCDRPPAWTDAHHVIHWADGGSTSLDNLVLLCRHHHDVVHHAGWTVALDAAAHPQFRPPDAGAGYPVSDRRTRLARRQGLRAVVVPPEPPPEPAPPEPPPPEPPPDDPVDVSRPERSERARGPGGAGAA